MESIEKAPEIKEAEKIKGIVRIGFNDEPKKKVKKKIKKHLFIEDDIIAEKSIKGDFDKEPIQNIKPIKKVHYKPFVSEIQEEKIIENEERKENIGNNEIKLIELNNEIAEQERLLKLRRKEQKEEEKRLKKELKLKKKAEKKEQKAKRKVEKREKRRKHWYFRIFMRKEKSKEIPVKEVTYQNPNEVKLIELDYTNLKKCPICDKKLRKTKVEYDFNILKQTLKCKKCNFKKDIAIKL